MMPIIRHYRAIYKKHKIFGNRIFQFDETHKLLVITSSKGQRRAKIEMYKSKGDCFDERND